MSEENKNEKKNIGNDPNPDKGNDNVNGHKEPKTNTGNQGKSHCCYSWLS